MVTEVQKHQLPFQKTSTGNLFLKRLTCMEFKAQRLNNQIQEKLEKATVCNDNVIKL